MDDVVVTITPRTIVKGTLIAAAVVAMAVALPAARGIVADLAVAAAVACLVRPGVLRLARHMRAGLATFLVYAAVFVGLLAFLALEAGALNVGTKELRHAVPDRLERLQQRLAPGNTLRRFLVEDHVVARVRGYINAIPSRFIFGTTSPFRSASQIGAFVLIASLSAFMISRGPSIFRALVARLPTRWQESASTAGRAAYHQGGAYVRRTLLLAAGSGVLAGLLAFVCGVPGAPVIGLWVGLWAFIPTFGIVVGSLPAVALAFGQGTAPGVGTLIGSIAIAAAAESARRRWIEGPTVSVGPLLSLVAVIVGMELGRWMIAFLLLIAVAFFAAATDSRRGARPAATTDVARGGPAEAERVETSTRASGRLSVELDTGSLVLAGVVGFAVVVLVSLVRSVPHSLARLAIGVFIALALNPVVDLLQRRFHGRRRLAVTVVVVAVMTAAIAFALYSVPRAAQQSRRVRSQVQTIVSQLDRAPIVGARIRKAHVDTRIRRTLDDLPHVLTTHDRTLRDAARTAGDSLLTGSWMLLIAVAALLDGPDTSERFKTLFPPERRAKAERLGDLTYQTVGRSAGGTAFSALLQGAVVMVIALAFQVPLAPVLAANAALWAFVPQVGGLLAGLPVFIFALSRGLPTAVICGLLFVVWMVTNNHLLHPLIVGRSVHISPLASLVAVLVGVSLGGFVGGVLATPIVGVVRALVSPVDEPQAEAASPPAPPTRVQDRAPPEHEHPVPEADEIRPGA